MTAPVTAGSRSALPEGPGAPPGGAIPPARARSAPPGEARVLDALAAVRDPELDEPITALGFVASCAVSADGDASVRLRLPTYFCAPNFAFLMVADAYDAVSGLPGVRRTEVVLEDHFASDAINGGVAARPASRSHSTARRHRRAAPAAGRLPAARAVMVEAPTRCAGTCWRPGPSSLGCCRTMTLGQVPASRVLDRLRQRRAELGLYPPGTTPRC